MKTLLQCKADRLFRQAVCPVCKSHKTGAYRAAGHFEHAVETPGFVPNPDDKAAVRYFCGAELSIDENDTIINRIPCGMAMANEADGMDIDANTAFEMQEKAA